MIHIPLVLLPLIIMILFWIITGILHLIDEDLGYFMSFGASLVTAIVIAIFIGFGIFWLCKHINFY